MREKARSMPCVVNTHCGAEVFKRWPMLACDICMPSKRIVYPNNVQVLCKCHHHRFPQGADTYTCTAAWQPIDWFIDPLSLSLSLSLSLHRSLHSCGHYTMSLIIMLLCIIYIIIITRTSHDNNYGINMIFFVCTLKHSIA